MIPVEKSMTVLELKQAFIEASKAAASSEEDAVETKPANIKLFKQGVDSEGNESWVALDDKATVDRAGLDQGHVVGASFASQGATDLRLDDEAELTGLRSGKFAEPVIANPEDENAEPPML